MPETYILELKVNIEKQSDRNYLQRYFEEVAKIGNTVRRLAIRQLNLLRRDPNYIALLKQYNALSKEDPARKQISAQLTAIVQSYGLSKRGVEKFATQLRRNLSHVHSDVYQNLCSDVWRSVEKCLYGNGKQIHFKKWTEFTSFEGKKNTTGIIYQNGKVYINCGPKHPKGGIVLSVILPSNENSLHYLYETSCLNDRTRHCRIVRKMFPSGWQYYVQLVQESTPPQKHAIGVGRVGVDIGTSTAAVVADDGYCSLKELGETVQYSQKEVARLQRKMDRSRRQSNPGNYKADGSIREGKKTWVYSQSYYKTRNLCKTLQRKQSASLKQWQEAYANEVIEHGDEIFVETMSFRSLQKRAKTTAKSKKSKVVKTASGVKIIHPYQRKKRFSKSIGMHAPGQLIRILKRKLQTNGIVYEVNTRQFRASQYDHISDSYVRKKLSKRNNVIGGEWIQRDLYSAFLLKNSDSSLEHTDRNRCFITYPVFRNAHHQCIDAIKYSYKKVPSCFGIKTVA